MNWQDSSQKERRQGDWRGGGKGMGEKLEAGSEQLKTRGRGRQRYGETHGDA